MSLKSILLPERDVPKVQQHLLDRDIETALSQHDVPVDMKYQLYQNILHQYKQLQGQLKKPLQLDFVHDSQPKINLSVESFPKTLRQRASNLVNFIKTLDHIAINEKGELVYKSNPVRGSNFTDLVHDFVRDRRGTRPPLGARELALSLRDANVPREFIGNRNRWSLIEGGPNLFSSSSRPQSGEGRWIPY